MSSNKSKPISKVLVYTKNGQVDFKAMLPDYAVLTDAMERGQSWYDLMYPRNLTAAINAESMAGKKRKNPFEDYTGNKNKKPRYE
jgi:hypothetical protein